MKIKSMSNYEVGAKYLKAKKSSIYDKVHSKSIPFLKYGNSLRFRKKLSIFWHVVGKKSKKVNYQMSIKENASLRNWRRNMILGLNSKKDIEQKSS